MANIEGDLSQGIQSNMVKESKWVATQQAFMQCSQWYDHYSKYLVQY